MNEKKMSIMVCFNESAAAENAVLLSKQHAKTFDADVHIITSFTQRSDVKEKDLTNMLLQKYMIHSAEIIKVLSQNITLIHLSLKNH